MVLLYRVPAGVRVGTLLKVPLRQEIYILVKSQDLSDLKWSSGTDDGGDNDDWFYNDDDDLRKKQYPLGLQKTICSNVLHLNFPIPVQTTPVFSVKLIHEARFTDWFR